jgi:putative peptide zinc metalloprotease protein
VLHRYALFGLAWSLLAAVFAAGMSLRYVPELERFAPGPVVWAGLAVVWLTLLTPALVTLVAPSFERSRPPGASG